MQDEIWFSDLSDLGALQTCQSIRFALSVLDLREGGRPELSHVALGYRSIHCSRLSLVFLCP
jgi:hypothetical protein